LTAVGIDLASIAEICQALADLGDRYLRRLFTPAEVADCHQWPDPVPHLASRFAAKEAAFKVLGMGTRQPPWTCIEVRTNAAGRAEMLLSGAAAQAAAARGVQRMLVSLSSAGENAAAVVVAQLSPGGVNP
jgi:holo-[acyl-carrier protein] synthase